VGSSTPFAREKTVDYELLYSYGRHFKSKTSAWRVRPEWFADGSGLRYRIDREGGKRAFVVVDAERGRRTEVAEADKRPVVKKPEKPKRWHPNRGGSPGGNRSPDGKWEVVIEDNNVSLRETGSKETKRLTTDGVEKAGYRGGVFWSPDSRKFVVIKQTRVEDRKVYIIESSPKDRVQPKLHNYKYRKPGDPIPMRWPHLFDVVKGRIPLKQDLFKTPWQLGNLRWDADSGRFCFYYNQRGHQVVRVVAVDAGTGIATALVDETPKTFVDYSQKTMLHWLSDKELIWMSERDGWNHLYLYDAGRGKVKRQITRGKWVVREVIRIDAKKREIEFKAMGMDPDQDPYHVHYCRIGFDGMNLVRLTRGDGTHELEYSPDGRFYLDRYSRVDMAPVTELRRTRDGRLMCVLEKGDLGPLLAAGFRPPERFKAKGADGRTDIYGVIYTPSTFDPKKRYAVIENIYAGPHGFFVPKKFRVVSKTQRMAELGFVLVRIDGRGTNWRSKAFHDVCWRNVGDAGLDDRVAWMKAAARTRPWMDISRVGIFGGSAGGQSAMRALVMFPDFYKVAVADCGCHDNRMDKIWWNEAWMGWPIGEHYKQQSNVTMAHRLKGKLMLVVGELDRNVDPASTLQVVGALIKADKDFDLLLMVGSGHGSCENRYGQRRRADFFMRHLQGIEPKAKAAKGGG
jgi:dipeptidyl aminopeptidase/acylaminoacyl peptidase